jgi:trehalose 2-sulfotransferase
MSKHRAGPPERSYIIWFTQRVGSTMLTQALEDTGLAGRPREWLNAGSGQELLARHGVPDAEELRRTLWRNGTTDNGVFGVKYAMTKKLHRELTTLFGSVVPGEPEEDGRLAWEAFFPRCRHVFMTRRDKLRLAVSWWRAITSEEWHRPNRARTVVGPAARPKASELEGRYDYDALHHLLVETNLREAAMQEQFARWEIVPCTVVYEDLIASYEETVRGVLRFLEIPDAASVPVPSPAFDRIADEISESWYRRFRDELGPRED